DQIGGTTDPYFEDLKYEVALSSQGQQLDLVYHVPPSKATVRTLIEPRRQSSDMNPLIGISWPETTQLFTKDPDSNVKPWLKDSATARHPPTFEFGDTIVGTTDPEPPETIKALPMDPRDPVKPRPSIFELRRRLQLLAGQPLVLQVRRESGDSQPRIVDIK